MQKIIGVDPGSKESAVVVFDPATGSIGFRGKVSNFEVLGLLEGLAFDGVLVIEQIKSYGNAMGDTLLETCVWTGRFMQAFLKANPSGQVARVPRKTIVATLCMNTRANDSHVRQALIDFFASRTGDNGLGGGKVPVIGTKSNPGPLWGFASDMWSALAVCVSYDMKCRQEADILARLVD